MNKKIFIAALGLCAIASTAAFAQQPGNSESNKKENRAKDRNVRRAPEAPNPFDGLNLSAEQQTKLDALKAERKANREAQAKLRQEARKAKRDGACAARAAQLAKIKKILTPEQYVKFLENSYLTPNKGKIAGKGNGRLARHDRKDKRQGRGGKSSTPQRPAQQPEI